MAIPESGLVNGTLNPDQKDIYIYIYLDFRSFGLMHLMYEIDKAFVTLERAL